MGQDTSRVQVKTYVPAYQKEEWKNHADELDMSQSEFVRTMVQAGRRGFGEDVTTDGDRDEQSDRANVTEISGAQSGGLEDDVVTALDEAGPLSWDELLATLTDDIERRLEDALERLQRDDRIRYSGREDGYVLIEE